MQVRLGVQGGVALAKTLDRDVRTGQTLEGLGGGFRRRTAALVRVVAGAARGFFFLFFLVVVVARVGVQVLLEGRSFGSEFWFWYEKVFRCFIENLEVRWFQF